VSSAVMLAHFDFINFNALSPCPSKPCMARWKYSSTREPQEKRFIANAVAVSEWYYVLLF